MRQSHLSSRRGNAVLWTILGICGVGFLVILLCGFWGISLFQQEQQLRNSVEAKLRDRDLVFDTMFKIIKQKAGITDKYKEDFRDIYPDLISGRYKSGGSLAKFVTESNPEYDSSLLKDLMSSVEAERKNLLNKQQELNDVWLAHTDLVTVPPGSFVLGIFGKNARIAEVTFITSSITKETSETGEENDIKLFDKEN